VINKRRRTLIGFVFVSVGVLLALLFGQSIFQSFTQGTNSLVEFARTTASADNPIAAENNNSGTISWQVVRGKMATTQIQAYVGMRSVAHGQTITFYVSTQQAGTHYDIAIYRMGWYQGTGGRLMTTISAQVGQSQGYYDPGTATLLDCGTCYQDPATGLLEARWQPSYTLTIPHEWTTGIYLVKFIDANGFQTYTSFVVTGNPTSTYIVVTPDTTYAAYNNWGGRSLYDYNSTTVRAAKVSLLRPSTQQYGSDQVLIFMADAIHWLERKGYDLSYMSDIDLHANAATLLKHKAYISLGHDEYWTKEMRDGVEYARDQGVSLAFLEANASYWQARLEPSATGLPNQTVVSYKVGTTDHNLENDPFYQQDNSRVTAQWRDPVVNRPENAMIGIMFSDLTHGQHGFPWSLAPTAKNNQLLLHTSLQPGQSYGCGLVGYEWDKVFHNGATPAGLQILASSPTTNDQGVVDSSNTTVYIAPSHAMVFATGSVYWTAALDSYRFDADPSCEHQPLVVAGMQELLAIVMAQLVSAR